MMIPHPWNLAERFVLPCRGAGAFIKGRGPHIRNAVIYRDGRHFAGYFWYNVFKCLFMMCFWSYSFFSKLFSCWDHEKIKPILSLGCFKRVLSKFAEKCMTVVFLLNFPDHILTYQKLNQTLTKIYFDYYSKFEGCTNTETYSYNTEHTRKMTG